MDCCTDIPVSFNTGGYLNMRCGVTDYNDTNSYTSGYYNDVSKIKSNGINGYNTKIIVCQYASDNTMVSRESYTGSPDLEISVNPSFKTRVSYENRHGTLPQVQSCKAICSMGNELAFGNNSFLSSVSSIVPFIVIMIAFAFGYYFLKKLVSSSSKGKAKA